MSFPTLTKNPSAIDEKSTVNIIKNQFDGGYKQVRERFSRDIKDFTVTYAALNEADKNALLSHYDTVRGSTPFTWVNVDNSTSYTVRYTDSIDVKADAQMPKLYAITLKMETV